MIDPPSSMNRAAQITAVVVLYAETPSASAALQSLLAAAEQVPEARQRMSLLIYDNSSRAAAIPTTTLATQYIHDPENAGLARAYNTALTHASAEGSTWLLLLDQDTTLSIEYLTEMLAAADALAHEAQVGAIVPKLWAGTRLYSPEAPFLWQIRKQHSNAHYSVNEAMTGIHEEPLTAYNSGAALRVSTLNQIGGFPEAFWLDYLDHAVFQQLRLQGYRTWVMRTVLQQKLSHMDLNTVPMWRHWSVLAAQTRFVLEYGNAIDKLYFRWWLFKTSRTFRSSCSDKRVWRLRASQAFLLRRMTPRYPDGQHA